MDDNKHFKDIDTQLATSLAEMMSILRRAWKLNNLNNFKLSGGPLKPLRFSDLDQAQKRELFYNPRWLMRPMPRMRRSYALFHQSYGLSVYSLFEDFRVGDVKITGVDEVVRVVPLEAEKDLLFHGRAFKFLNCSQVQCHCTGLLECIISPLNSGQLVPGEEVHALDFLHFDETSFELGMTYAERFAELFKLRAAHDFIGAPLTSASAFTYKKKMLKKMARGFLSASSLEITFTALPLNAYFYDGNASFKDASTQTKDNPAFVLLRLEDVTDREFVTDVL